MSLRRSGSSAYNDGKDRRLNAQILPCSVPLLNTILYWKPARMRDHRRTRVRMRDHRRTRAVATGSSAFSGENKRY